MYDTNFIKNNSSQVGFNPQGGYITSWRVNNQDILYSGSTIRRTGIPILFPYYGKAKETRMHGFGRDSFWRIVEAKGEMAIMELSSKDLTPDARKEYPYQFTAQIHVSLPSETSLQYELKVKNNGESMLPLSPGLHPYWSHPHEKKKNIQITGIRDFNAQTIDWNNAPPDTPYDFTGTIEVDFGERKLRIEEATDNKVIKYIQVWSQTPAHDPDFNFVCIEPICGLNYGIDESPLLVAPQDNWSMKVTFSLS